MMLPFTVTLTKGEKVWIPTQDAGGDFTACSIHAEAENGSWSSGVVTVKKANGQNLAPVDINGSPVTISADGMKELAGTDWFKAGWLVLDVTTDGSAALVRGVVVLKRLGFSV